MRQAIVVTLAERGLPPSKIAKQLDLSRGYVENICRKLGLQFGGEVVRGLSESGKEARRTAKCLADSSAGRDANNSETA